MNSFAPYLLLLSGFSALTYQVVWLRLLGLSIGMTSAAVGAVLAAVFLGMALGSWMAGRIPAPWQGRLKSFAMVEALVGVSALVLLPVLLNLDHLMALMPSLGSQLWFRFMVATLLLAIPAAGLGAAYPLMSATLIRQQQQLSRGLAQLYALHTAGAVGGALISAFFLIPWWGLDGALYCAVSVNLLVAIIAYRLKQGEVSLQTQEQPTKPQTPSSKMGLVVLCVTGLTAVAVQVGWIKYLAIFTESTFFGYSLLIAMSLACMALGTGFIQLLLPRIKRPESWLVWGLLLLAFSMFVTRSGLSYMPSIETYVEQLQLRQSTTSFINYGSILLMLFPSGFLFGVLFPLSLATYCGDIRSMYKRVGQGYAFNTLAGLVGAVTAGMWLIPQYGTDRLLVIIAMTLSLLSLLLFRLYGTKPRRFMLPLFSLSLVLFGPMMPKLSFEKMILCMECSEKISRQGGNPDFIFLKEGHSGVVSLVTYDGYNFMLENNGLEESRISLTRSNRYEVLLGMLPHLFNPTAKSAFVIGYGSGTGAEVLAATELETIQVVEMEPAIVEAMQALEEMDSKVVDNIKKRDTSVEEEDRKGATRAMDNSRVTINYNDARNILLMDPKRYDIIIAQTLHPWRAGAAPLLTSEFFRIVHSRLNENGVFNQRINVNRIDALTVKSILRAFYEEFPRGVIFANKDTADLFLLGADSALSLDFDQVSKLVMRPDIAHYSWTLGIRRPAALLEYYYLMSRDNALALVDKTDAHTDLNLLSELKHIGLQERLDSTDDPRHLLKLITIH